MSGEDDPGQPPGRFPKILDLVFRLSDGAWRTVISDVSLEVSQLQFVVLSTNTVVSAARSVLQRYTPTLIGAAGAETAPKRAESESVGTSGPSTTTDSTGPSSSTSAERSSMDQSDATCDTVEDFLREVMEKSICKVASSKAPPLPGNWKMTNSPLGDHSSQTPESLVAQPVHITTSRETTSNHVSPRDDLTISCTHVVCGGIKRLHHTTASCAVWNIPALNTGSTALIRSSRRTVSPIVQLSFNSCTDEITMKVVEIHKSELLLSSSSNVSLLNFMLFHKQPAVRVPTITPQACITEAGEAASRATSHEEDIVFEELDSAPQIETAPLQGPSMQVTEFMNMTYLDVLSVKPGSSGGTDPSPSLMVLDKDTQETSTSGEAQERTSNTALSPTYRISGETEDPLALLLDCEQAEYESMADIFARDIVSLAGSPNPSIKAGSETVRDTLESRSTSSQETSSSSSSPLSDREPEAVRKRSGGFHFFVARKAPFISFRQKKSTKAGPAGVESRNHQPDPENHQPDPENHQPDSGNRLSCSALQRGSTATPLKKPRKRLSRMFSAVCKALPNPFSCMSPPS